MNQKKVNGESDIPKTNEGYLEVTLSNSDIHTNDI